MSISGGSCLYSVGAVVGVAGVGVDGVEVAGDGEAAGEGNEVEEEVFRLLGGGGAGAADRGRRSRSVTCIYECLCIWSLPECYTADQSELEPDAI